MTTCLSPPPHKNHIIIVIIASLCRPLVVASLVALRSLLVEGNPAKVKARSAAAVQAEVYRTTRWSPQTHSLLQARLATWWCVCGGEEE